jgi:hypothetical protein
MTRLLRTASVCVLVVIVVTLASTSPPAGARTRPTVSKLTRLWTARLVGPGTSPVVSGNDVYATAINPKPSKRSAPTASDLYAFGATCPPAPAGCAETLSWFHSFPAVGVGKEWYAASVTPTAAGNGNVYVGENQIGADQYDGTEQAFAAASGAPGFSNRQGGTSTPAVANGVVASNWVFQCCEAEENFSGTEALNASTGAQLFTTFSSPSGPPAVGAGSLFVGSGGALGAYDASGKDCVPPSVPPSELEEYEQATGFPEVCVPLWSAATEGTVTASAAVAGTEMYVGDSDGQVYAFPAAGCGSSECEPDWTGMAGGSITTSVAVGSTRVFVASSNGTLSAFPVGGCGSATCAPMWTASVGGSLSAPTLAGSLVYVTSSTGLLTAFPVGGCGAATCGPAWQATLHAPSDTAPAAGHGLIFVTDTDHDLYAFRQP